MGAPCLEARGTLTTPHGVPLYRLTLRLPCGGVALIHGPNGSGKTMLLRSISGLAPGALQGFLRVERPLFYAPAGDFHLQGLRVWEWFWLHATRPTGPLQASGGEALDSLSRGWRRLAQLWAAVDSGARVMLVDEPFTGLDDERAQALASLLAGAAARGSLVVATAPEGEAERARRLLEWAAGRLVSCGVEGGVLDCAA